MRSSQGSHAMTSSQRLSKNACHDSYQDRGTHTHISLEDPVTNNAHIDWFLLFSSKTNMVNSGRTSPTTHGRTHTLYTTTESTSGHEDPSKHTATTRIINKTGEAHFAYPNVKRLLSLSAHRLCVRFSLPSPLRSKHSPISGTPVLLQV